MIVTEHKKEQMRTYSRKYGKERNKKIRLSLFEYLGSPVCKRCGFSDVRALQIDHINGGGNKERKSKTSYLPKLIKENPSNYQILCANCNWIKRVENSEATGQPRK